MCHVINTANCSCVQKPRQCHESFTRIMCIYHIRYKHNKACVHKQIRCMLYETWHLFFFIISLLQCLYQMSSRSPIGMCWFFRSIFRFTCSCAVLLFIVLKCLALKLTPTFQVLVQPCYFTDNVYTLNVPADICMNNWRDFFLKYRAKNSRLNDQ